MNEKLTVVVGGQYGSEAKGKVVSFLAPEVDVAVRTGSPNAGHTVFHEGVEYKLQQIPATFVNPNCQLTIGAGALIDPEVLIPEVERTQTKDRLYIDRNAGIIEQRHKDREARSGIIERIGSTGKGVGAARYDLLTGDPDFKFSRDVLHNDFTITNVSEYLMNALKNDSHVLVEGTQGFGLSLHHGEYPYTTSIDTTAAKFLSEAGLPPTAVTDIIMVLRTYPIRVAGNSGPLANEISWEELSERIGKPVIERTTVTNNIRRVGEFDYDLVKRAVMFNRPTQIALQFLNYKFPEDEGVSSWEQLSPNARSYVEDMELELDVPITIIGTSQANEGMIDRR